MATCECNGRFSRSSLERDSNLIGGKRIQARIFGESIEFTGILESVEDKYVLAVDIIPDQSRVFHSVKVRVDGLDYTNFKVHERQDGLKVVTVLFEIKDRNIRELFRKIDLIWIYSSEDLERPEIFNSTIEVNMTDIAYEKVVEAPGITRLSGEYVVQEGDFDNPIAQVCLQINPIDEAAKGLSLREYNNYKEDDSKYLHTVLTDRLGDFPIRILGNIRLSPDTLKVENRKLELEWFTPEGKFVEIFYIDTETLGWDSKFSAPLPIFLEECFYNRIDISGVDKKLIFEPQYRIVFKGDSELAGEGLNFFIRTPKGLPLEDIEIHILINDEEVVFDCSESADNDYSYTHFSVESSLIPNNAKVQVKVKGVYSESESEYTADFSELF